MRFVRIAGEGKDASQENKRLQIELESLKSRGVLCERVELKFDFIKGMVRIAAR